MTGARVSTLTAVVLAAAVAAAAQEQGLGLPDPFRLLEPKGFVARRASSNSPDPRSNDDSHRPIPGETVVLADLPGPGVVSHIWLTVAASEYGWPRLLRLRIYYDGSPAPSVDAPLGDFFAVGHGFEGPVRSLMARASSEGRSRNSYWPMPFRRSCRITVTNEGRRRVANLYYHVDWQKLPALPEGTPYFHAWYRQALPAPPDGSPYEILSVRGRGHYVGTVMSVVQAEAGWFGEGDDLFYVDGEEKPSIEGTGSEDYFNDAWGLHVDEGPYTGVPVAEGTGLGSRMTAYRWHLADPVPFTKALRFVMEHKGWTFNADGSVKSAFGERTDLVSSVAFWYQEGIASDQPPVPYGPARLPQGNAAQIEVEAALADVRPQTQIDAYALETYVGADYQVGWPRLTKGRHTLSYVCLGRNAASSGYNLGVDNIVLARTGAEAWAAAAVVREPMHPSGSVADIARALSDTDPVTRGLAALELRARGEAARPALDSLVGALRDPDPNIRLMSANAIAAIGAPARPAVPALVAACSVRDEEVHVLRACATALGAIGPAAASAVPALREIAKQPRVRWAAEAAIRRIEGQE